MSNLAYYYYLDESRFSPLLSTDKDQPSFCPNHWVPYAGNCYYLERNKKIWRDALAACHKEGGDLASIHNIEEQSFIISQSGYCKCAIGLFFPQQFVGFYNNQFWKPLLICHVT